MIRSKRGGFVESKLFKELLDISVNRAQAVRIYQGVHSPYFLKRFGDWINHPESSSLAVDENGEPLLVSGTIADSYEQMKESRMWGFVVTRDEAQAEHMKKHRGFGQYTNDLKYDQFMDATSEVDIIKQEHVHDDPKIIDAIKEHGALTINNANNPYVWEIEDEFGLVEPGEWRTDRVTGKRFRVKRKFKYKEATKLAKEITESADNRTATVAQVGRRYVVKVEVDISMKTVALNKLSARLQESKDAEQKLRDQGRFGYLIDRPEQIDELEKLRRKALEVFEARMSAMEKKYSFTARASFEEFFDEFLSSNNTTEAIISMVTHAAKTTSDIWKRFEKAKENGNVFTPQMLQTWYDYLGAYDLLDDLLNTLTADPSLINNPKLVAVLQDTITRKNAIKAQYTTQGVKLMAEWLTPYYNGIVARKRELLRTEYRKQALRKKKGKKHDAEMLEKGIDEYVESEITRLSRSLQEETTNLLQKELVTASRDINMMSRWLDNMLDTSDPVSAAIVNAFVEADQQSRIEAIKMRTKFINALREFEESTGKTNTMSELDFYEDLLEFDKDGVPTGYLAMPWSSDIMQEERRQREKLFKKGLLEDDPDYIALTRGYKAGEYSKADYRAAVRKMAAKRFASWQEANVQILNDAYVEGFMDAMDEFEATGVMSHTDALWLKNAAPYIKVIKSGLEDNQISEEAADIAIQWIQDNRWTYSNVIDRWKNPRWEKLMKKWGIPTDIPYYQQLQYIEQNDNPAAKFYKFITQISKEADGMVPYSYRLGYRLPGISKSTIERIKQGQNAGTIVKEEFKEGVFQRVDDTERGESYLVDENGNPKMFLPIHYAGKMDIKNQSFDLASIYFKWWESANDYQIKRKILPELEMAKHFVDIRKAKRRNALGDVVKRKFKVGGQIDDLDESNNPDALIENTQVAQQLTDWFEMAVYGQKARPGGLISIKDDLVLDTAKLADVMNKYTAFNMLAFNLVQGTANVILGETMQAIDAVAKEHVTASDLTKATKQYMKWLPGMMGDWGSRLPQHVGTHLIEWAHIMHDDVARVNWSKRTKVGQELGNGALFAMQEGGEHWMQSRYLFARLIHKQAYDKDGNHLGNMLEMYYMNKDGELALKDEVDLEKSKWTAKDQEIFRRATLGQLSRMHGEYSELGRIALQRAAIGRMAYMFRKFIVPGAKRRFQKRQYVQRLDQYVEGNYVTTWNFAKRMFTEAKILKWALMSEDWALLTDHEKANIKRTITEIATVATTIVVANLLYKSLKDDDDDDDKWKAFLAYEAFRVKSELLFFVNPVETMKILNSPAAAMSLVENTIQLFKHLMPRWEEYERGPWKNHYKFEKDLMKLVPLYKQYYKVRDIGENVTWFKT